MTTPDEPPGTDATDGDGDGDGDGSEPAAERGGHRRPVIEKVKTDREIIHIEGHEYGEEMSIGQRVLYRSVWLFMQAIARSYFRARIYGHQNVPRTGSFIVSPIHRSNLDTPFIGAITSRRLRFMGKESLWKSRFGAWFLTTMGGFPVDRGTADREALRASIAVVERGEPIVLFPEGTRQFGPDVCEMFDGPAYIACRMQVPIVPVGLGGTEAALGKGRKFPRPQRLTMVVGEPIQPPPPSERGRVPRQAVRALTEELGERIQELFDEAQERAGTPNRR